jgi:hypothetical protein
MVNNAIDHSAGSMISVFAAVQPPTTRAMNAKALPATMKLIVHKYYQKFKINSVSSPSRSVRRAPGETAGR